MTVTLAPGATRLADLARIYWEAAPASLTPTARPAVDQAAERIAMAAQGQEPVYGVNTGF